MDPIEQIKRLPIPTRLALMAEIDNSTSPPVIILRASEFGGAVVIPILTACVLSSEIVQGGEVSTDALRFAIVQALRTLEARIHKVFTGEIAL